MSFQMVAIGDGTRRAWVRRSEVAAVATTGHDVVVVLRSGVRLTAMRLKQAEGPAGPEHVDAVVKQILGAGT